jgi:hypothetical protein
MSGNADEDRLARAASLREQIERWMLASVALVVGIISLADLLGVLESELFTERLPVITLLVLCAILGHQALYLTGRLRLIETDVAEMQMNRFRRLRERLDPEMLKVFGDHVTELIQNVNSAVHNQQIRITDLDLFRYFYRETLKAYPRKTFLATSVPDRKYFWKNDAVEEKIADFTKHGGTMKRVFFFNRLDGPLTDSHLTEEQREILVRQMEIGVEVYATCRAPRDLDVLFFTESTGRIAWTATVGQDSEMKDITASSNRGVNERYVRTSNSIMALHTTCRMHSRGGTLVFEPVREAQKSGRAERKGASPP